MKRIISIVLMVCMLAGMTPFRVTAQEMANTVSAGDVVVSAEEAVLEDEVVSVPVLPLSTGDTVSRIDWLRELTTLFDMTVTEDNYPDNYYSDIDSAYEYYYDVMLATEFGLVDVEAGEPFLPDDPATREFAAHTLNLCLGYAPEDGESVTFTEAAQVTYEQDIAVAISRGWFTLQNGAFLPPQSITVAEKDVMIADAAAAVAETVVDTGYADSYEFADDVIVLPTEVETVMTDENQLTLTNCTTELKAGDVFGVVSGGLPVAYKVISIETVEEKLVVQTETLDTREAFKSIDVQGDTAVDLAVVQAYDDSVALSFIVGGSEAEQYADGAKYDSVEAVGNQEISAIEAIQTFDIPESVQKEYDIAPGVKAQIVCKISNVTNKFKVNSKGVYLDVDAKVSFSCNVSMDVLNAMGVAPSLDLVYVPVGYVGYMKLTLDMSMEGQVTVSTVVKVGAGVQYVYGKGFRAVTRFSKESFTIQAEAEASVGVKFTIGLDCGVLEGSIYGKTGGKAIMTAEVFTDGQSPTTCAHVTAWLYASIGYKVEVHLLVVDEEWKKDNVIYDESNSPVRVQYHFEDGAAVAACTRDGQDAGNTAPEAKKYKYYTPADSRYGYNGASTGVDSKGQPYTIFEYDLDDAGDATITSYNGNVSALSIPNKLDGHEVVAIDNAVFQDKLLLRSVMIPDSVITIEKYAFDGCLNLESVVLSGNLETIGYRAFGNCDSLASIEIPKSLQAGAKFNEWGTFYDCDGLKTVTFETGMTKVPAELFAGCSGLEEIVIPDTVTVVEESAFYCCGNLQEVTLSQNTTEIQLGAFQNCTSLKTIELPDSLGTIKKSAFADCAQLEAIEIPDSVITIGDYAFDNCTKLADAKLSKNLETIGYRAFGNCDSLTSIEIPKSLQAGAKFNEWGTFYDCDGLKTVTFETGMTKVPAELFAGCSGLEEIVIPDTVTVVEESAFYCCGNLKEVTLSQNTTEIQLGAFQECTNLQAMEMPDIVISLGQAAFKNCANLETLVLSEGLTKLNNYTFTGCGIREIDLPERLTEMGYEVFMDCTELTVVTGGENLMAIPRNAFENNTSLEAIALGNHLVEIGKEAFRNCEALSSIRIPDSVTKMGDYCFAECDVLADVKLGTGLTVIPAYAFNLCSGLESVVLPYRIASVKSNAFTNCTNLTEVTIPRATTSIADGVFSYPTGMTIYGIAGTYAETYAEGINATFVNREVNAEAVSLSSTSLTVNKGADVTLALTVTPENFTDEVAWKSTDTSVVTVSDAGVITAKGIGTATIRVTVGSKKASCVVTVVQPVTSISLDKTSISLEGGDTFTLTATAKPGTANEKGIVWSSSDESIATVDQNGKVTALCRGVATITATAVDGSGTYRNCTVNVLSSTYPVTTVAKFASAHPYDNGCADTWIYTDTSTATKRLDITFSADTEVEEDFDFLYVYDKDDNEIGKYTGSELAGKTLLIGGNTVKVKLVSDEQTTGYGFAATAIVGKEKERVQDKYKDVEEGWYLAYVQYAYDTGLMSGYSATSFAPDVPLTRAQFITVLYNTTGRPPATYQEIYSDVKETDYFAAPVVWAYDKDIASGIGNNKYGSNANIRREQLALMLYKYARLQGADTTYDEDILENYPDIGDISDYAMEALKWAVSHNIMSGKNTSKGTYLDPQGNATRAECATMMMKYANMQ